MCLLRNPNLPDCVGKVCVVARSVVISSCLPFPPCRLYRTLQVIDPYVALQVLGVDSDSGTYVTKYVDDNGKALCGLNVSGFSQGSFT